jgi:lipopolysaccharide/colanic/teichoic acid biosynthesis glycosyltransferase
LIISILIKIDSQGSIFFKQERVGVNENIFIIYKFRSMVKDAEFLGSFKTRTNDKRITKIGKFIRTTSIDELPQLINVIIGDMSIVGPRPNLIEQKSEYSLDDWRKRNSIRPGITGLAQALKRSNASHKERTRLDLIYVENHSFSYDFYIVIQTIKQVFFKRGVN